MYSMYETCRMKDRSRSAANKYLLFKWDVENYATHRYNVKHAKARVDNGPPRTFSHMYIKPKKMQLELERYSAIQRNNRFLMERLATIEREGAWTENKNYHEVKSLNTWKRQQEMIQLAYDNQAMLARLMEVSAENNRNKLEDEYLINRKYKANIQKFPPNWREVQDHLKKIRAKIFKRIFNAKHRQVHGDADSKLKAKRSEKAYKTDPSEKDNEMDVGFPFRKEPEDLDKDYIPRKEHKISQISKVTLESESTESIESKGFDYQKEDESSEDNSVDEIESLSMGEDEVSDGESVPEEIEVSEDEFVPEKLLGERSILEEKEIPQIMESEEKSFPEIKDSKEKNGEISGFPNQENTDSDKKSVKGDQSAANKRHTEEVIPKTVERDEPTEATKRSDFEKAEVAFGSKADGTETESTEEKDEFDSESKIFVLNGEHKELEEIPKPVEGDESTKDTKRDEFKETEAPSGSKVDDKETESEEEKSDDRITIPDRGHTELGEIPKPAEGYESTEDTKREEFEETEASSGSKVDDKESKLEEEKSDEFDPDIRIIILDGGHTKLEEIPKPAEGDESTEDTKRDEFEETEGSSGSKVDNKEPKLEEEKSDEFDSVKRIVLDEEHTELEEIPKPVELDESTEDTKRDEFEESETASGSKDDDKTNELEEEKSRSD